MLLSIRPCISCRAAPVLVSWRSVVLVMCGIPWINWNSPRN